MTQSITQAVIKTTTAAIMAKTESDSPVNNVRPEYRGPGSHGPALRQSSFDWKSADT